MINITQVQSLEQKVYKAVELISRLRDENKKLRQKITGSETKIQELETLVGSFKNEQDAIEKSILNVLAKLDKLEDEVSSTGSALKKPNVKSAQKAEDADSPITAKTDEADRTSPGSEQETVPAGNEESGQTQKRKQDLLDIF
jgi:chromosome segregation ATPase